MIIPTAEYNAMYAKDGVPFREKMIRYIHAEFGDTLGPHANLLNTEQGLDRLAEMFAPATDESRQSRNAA